MKQPAESTGRLGPLPKNGAGTSCFPTHTALPPVPAELAARCGCRGDGGGGMWQRTRFHGPV